MHHSSHAPLVRYVVQDLAIRGYTFHSEEPQSCKHQPKRRKTWSEYQS